MKKVGSELLSELFINGRHYSVICIHQNMEYNSFYQEQWPWLPSYYKLYVHTHMLEPFYQHNFININFLKLKN